LRQLITNAFPFFSADQQQTFIKKVLDLKLAHELYPLRQDKFIPDGDLLGTRWGYTQGLFLMCLPAAQWELPEIKKRKEELRRLYPNLKEFVSKHYFGPARPTLKEQAYKFMNDKNWLNSFKTYNGKANENNFYKGGKTEHAERYAKQLTLGTDQYLELIKKTVYDTEVPMTYAIKGLNAMQDAKLPINEYLRHLLTREPDEDELYYLVELLCTAIQDQECDVVLLDYMINRATRPLSENNKIYANQKRAAEALVHVKDKKVKTTIFTAIRKILSLEPSKIQSSVLKDFAYLMQMDPVQTVQLFANAINQLKNLKDMEKITWSLSYIVNYRFEILLPFFDQVLQLSETSDLLIKNLTTILFSCWHYKYAGAEEYFMKFFNRFELSRSHALDLAIQHFYDDEKKSSIAEKIIYMALDDSSRKVSNKIKIKLLHIKHIKFTDFYPFLNKYVYSKSFRIGEYFIDYLTNHVTEHSQKCISLFEAGLTSNNRLTDEELNEMRHRNSPAKFIISAYNSVESENSVLRNKLLNLFDQVLKDDRFRTKTSEMLETLIN
jgi:hypothetical protein